MSKVHIFTESKQDYVTPAAFVALCEKRFNVRLMLDLACTEENMRCPYGITEAENSLGLDWLGALLESGPDHNLCAWLNPPFRGVGAWMQKCSEESAKGCKIISLTLASLGTKWYRDHVEGNALSLILRDRIAFEGMPTSFPKELMISLWGFGMTGLGFWSWKPEKNLSIRPPQLSSVLTLSPPVMEESM